MTDKELLEYAAKASGIKLAFYKTEKELALPFDIEHVRFWNPLTDDGDALRLAVKLHLEINYDGWGVPVLSEVGNYRFQIHVPELDYRNDPHVATRRAIVRAAAEIGNEMK